MHSTSRRYKEDTRESERPKQDPKAGSDLSLLFESRLESDWKKNFHLETLDKSGRRDGLSSPIECWGNQQQKAAAARDGIR